MIVQIRLNPDLQHWFLDVTLLRTVNHTRRRKTEENAKVVTSVWGDFIQFLAALAILFGTILKNRMSSSFSLKSSWCISFYFIQFKIVQAQNSYSASRSWSNSVPYEAATTFAFSFVFILILCCELFSSAAVRYLDIGPDRLGTMTQITRLLHCLKYYINF